MGIFDLLGLLLDGLLYFPSHQENDSKITQIVKIIAQCMILFIIILVTGFTSISNGLSSSDSYKSEVVYYCVIYFVSLRKPIFNSETLV